MRFSASWELKMPRATVYRFGYQVDQKHISWKSDTIRTLPQFRHIAIDSIMSEDVNQFQNIWMMVEVTQNANMGPLYGYIGTNFTKINLSAQDDSVTTNMPPTIVFRDLRLISAGPAFAPDGTWKMCQLLQWGFGRSEFVN